MGPPLRILLCSDVGSEGLNLHYFCYRLIHFELPWSLMIFQQRNGRVDRYGQKYQPIIVYLFTETSVEKIKGDLRILQILQQKDEQAQKNLGDPGIFLNLYDPEKEEEVIADYMARHATPEQVDTELERRAEEEEEGEGDWLMELFQAHPKGDAPKPADSLSHIQNPVSFFGDDYEFARTALASLSRSGPFAQWQANDEERSIAITPPKDLENRLRQLPREVQAEMYTLTADKSVMERSIEEARQKSTRHSDDPDKQLQNDANTWPKLHYLWPQQPILEWLGDRVLTAFGRHSAPVIQSERLATDEQAYILMALVPNRKAQPMLVEWQVACRRGKGAFALEDFASFAARAGLKSRALPNSAKVDLAPLQAGVPGAVDEMRSFMVKRQKAFAAEMQERLRDTLRDLERLQTKQLEEVNQRYAQIDLIFRQGKVEKRSHEIRLVFDDYHAWVEETMTTEPQPFIQLLAAVCR